MNKIITVLLLIMFSGLAMASSSSGALSFAPPPSDYSVTFLSALFGVVDGVLSGTGSQIMGSMFAVFNSAVLAIGGIIIMYTLMVSTMNTAHEGQMLGQKWSSIWIPARSTIGLALLIPKASGYCLMQIFVMWIVVQGVGAADKVWDAALGYLNRGGVIIQAQQINPAASLTSGNGGTASIAAGASTILAGQVCMFGLQTQLQNQRQFYLNAKANNAGPCTGPTPAMPVFCNTSVPDFMASVNAVAAQNNILSGNPNASTFSVMMPNFDSSSPYSFLNGICGTITWNNISAISASTLNTLNQVAAYQNKLQSIKSSFSMEHPFGEVNSNTNNTSPSPSPSPGSDSSVHGISLTPSELSTAQMSRAIAVQQMYVDLSSIAQIIIGNSPAMAPPGSSSNPNGAAPYIANVANQQFGVPFTQNSTVCTVYNQNCMLWGPAPGSSGTATLFNGTEFVNAINDYNGIMMPTLNLLAAMHNASTANSARQFINQASAQGWMMAGAYFFNLVQIQGSATQNASMIDSDSGLNNSSLNLSGLTDAFSSGNCSGSYSRMCEWFMGSPTPVMQVRALIDGSSIPSGGGTSANNPMTPLSAPVLTADSNRPAITSAAATTVFGFVNNSIMIQLPGQPGAQSITLAAMPAIVPQVTPYNLQKVDFDCGSVRIIVNICLGRFFGNLLYNVLFLNVYNIFMSLFQAVFNNVIAAFLVIPLQGMAVIFTQGVQTLSEAGVNPIVALANMGIQYINFAGNLWMMILGQAVSSAVIPIFGIFIFALLSLGMPLLIAWVSVMAAVGFVTAYYIPLLPYMIFTFGVLAWLIAVIEAMVAAPIVALGVTHPEGHDAFGKGEPAVMILLNVFLRPSMMIIGYIAAIALSYVGVWILNSGYTTAIGFVQAENTSSATWGATLMGSSNLPTYSDWAGIYAFFFSILTYTSMYLIMVQKSFSLISVLPDKVLRWIGGNPEGSGQDAASWAGEVKEQQKPAADATQSAQGQIDKKLAGYGQKALDSVSSGASSLGGSGSVEASGDSTPSSGDGGGGGGEGGGGAGDAGGAGGGGKAAKIAKGAKGS